MEWCTVNYVQQRVLNTVFNIRKQLREICSKKSMGLFMNACEYDKSLGRYRLLISPHTSLKIHPSSCLAREDRPTAFVFTELVQTNELYAR
ncbi:unnamed protein product [Gongylonema pulchrum]|uniref:OB_NTP_bind domain-containing protein n=1 Tax=Gongylonema pulchrum TaxID=637853 RepID=A0A183ESE2_9BILA|nr:unnamed protein product [Gongylonema pulchrum]